MALSVGTPKMAEANVESSPRPLPRPSVESPEQVSEDINEVFKELVYQSYEPPNEKALHYVSTLQNDLEIVLDRLTSLVADNEQYPTTMHLIFDQLELSSIPQPAQSAIRNMMMYVPYVESRFSNDAVSPVQAFGIMQLMPRTWEELGRSGEQRGNIVDQVRVAGRLLEQTYRHIMNEHEATIELITELLYEGDSERCGEEFICPVIINGYFSGMGTMTRLLDGFYEDYVNEVEKEKMKQQHILEDESGVYGLFSTAGELHGYSRYYGDESGKYVPKIVAAKQVIDDWLVVGRSST